MVQIIVLFWNLLDKVPNKHWIKKLDGKPSHHKVRPVVGNIPTATRGGIKVYWRPCKRATSQSNPIGNFKNNINMCGYDSQNMLVGSV